MPRVAFEVAWAEDAPRPRQAAAWWPAARATAEEVAPLVRKMGESAEWLEASENTDPAKALSWCCDDFRPRNLRSFHLLGWLVLQVAGLLFQLSLSREIGQQLVDFDTLLEENCGPGHKGLGDFCLGDTWSVAFYGVVIFPPNDVAADSDFDFVLPSDQSFGTFNTSSTPPTFLLAVEPLPPAQDVSWKVVVEPFRSGGTGISSVVGSGSLFKVITGSSWRAQTMWTAHASLRSQTTEDTRIRITIVDSRIQHLDVIHRQEQCSFERSWEHFSARHDGSHHWVLSITNRAMRVCLVISSALVGLLLYRQLTGIGGESAGLLRRAIGFKFLAHDFPQQVFIVLYLYGWYARNGLRCQMCLFRPEHCDNEDPLHSANFWACILTAVSALSNQVLIKAKARSEGRNSEDDECCECIFRFAMCSVSVLPFTTAIYLSPFCFRLHHFVVMLLLAAVPCMVGWATLCCGWVVIVFKDELDL